MGKIPPKPHVTINMAMSADGKISTHRRESFSLGSAEDRHLMDTLRSRVQAVVIGAGTLRLDGWAIRVRDPQIRARRVAGGHTPHPLNVVATTTLNLDPTSQFFTHPRTQKLVITTRQAPARRVRRLEGLATVIVLRRKRLRAGDVLDALSSRGVRRVLVEGGGEFNFSFFEEGLVDELYLTVVPLVIGGRTAPTPVDGKGFLKQSLAGLRLVSCKRRGDEVFLRYRAVSR